MKRLRWMATGGILVLVLSALTLTAGCGSREVQLDDGDNGKQIELEEGQTLAITVESNPSTGYSWARQDDPPDDVLVLVGEPEYRAKSTLPGGGGTETLRFRAERPGTTTLELIYRRPWEEDADPAATYTLTVSVR